MSLKKPTSDELVKLGDQLGFTIKKEDVESWLSVFSVDGYGALDELYGTNIVFLYFNFSLFVRAWNVA